MAARIWTLCAILIASSSSAAEVKPQQAAAVRMSEAKPSLSATADRLARATSSRKWHDEAAAMFCTASPDEERRLTLHENAGVALTAAWHRILRPLPEEYQQEPTRLSESDLHWFLGFVEERLRVKVPPWWADSVLVLHAHSRYSVFLPTQAAKRLDFAATETGYHVPTGLTTAKQGGSIVLTIGQSSCTILAATIWNSPGHGSHLIAANDGPDWFVASHTGGPSPYALMRVEPGLGKVNWKADVWATSYSYGLNWHGSHWATITLTKDSVVVFGLLSSGGPYIEAFCRRDGSQPLSL